MSSHSFTVGKLRFVVRATFRTGNYGVTLLDASGKVIVKEKGWGPIGCDALDRAAYYKNPSEAEGLLAFLFRRIDGYLDCPGIIDLWLGSTYERKIT